MNTCSRDLTRAVGRGLRSAQPFAATPPCREGLLSGCNGEGMCGGHDVECGGCDVALELRDGLLPGITALTTGCCRHQASAHRASGTPAGTSVAAICSTSGSRAPTSAADRDERQSPTAVIQLPGRYFPLRRPLASGSRARTPRRLAGPHTKTLINGGWKHAVFGRTVKSVVGHLNNVGADRRYAGGAGRVGGVERNAQEANLASQDLPAQRFPQPGCRELGIAAPVGLIDVDAVRAQGAQRRLQLRDDLRRRPVIGARRSGSAPGRLARSAWNW